MLVVRHKTGPLAGKEERIEPKGDRVTFGRDSAVCDIVYPPDATIVARRHFALVRKPSGEWTFDLFGDPFVAVNGEPAENGMAVHSGAKIELGEFGGPSFEIDLQGEGLANELPVTQPQHKVLGAHAVADHAEHSAVRARRFALIGLAIAILVGGGAAAFVYLARNEAARLNSALEALNREQAQLASESIPRAVRDNLLRAAYFVVTRKEDREEYGTASPIGPDLLATNAHVAESFLNRGPKGRMVVRAPGVGGREYEVVEVRIHPGYRAFQEFLDQDQFYVGDWRLTGAQIPSYDVAILRIAPGATLSPILEIAPAEEIANLAPGFPLARAGYPTEYVSGAEIQSQVAATPNLAVGMITGMTDMFRMPGDPAHQRLVHHSVPSAGGASGSPLVGPNGKIVALNNAGTYVFVKIGNETQRISSSVLINYGQRADWLTDLRDGRADQALDADMPYWKQQTAAFKRGIDVLVPIVVADMKPKSGGTPVQHNKQKVTFTASDRYEVAGTAGQDKTVKRQKIHSVKLTAGKLNSFLAYAENQAAIQMYLVIDGKIVQSDERQVFVPRVNYTASSDTTADIYIVGPDADVTYTLFQYDWDPPRS